MACQDRKARSCWCSRTTELIRAYECIDEHRFDQLALAMPSTALDPTSCGRPTDFTAWRRIARTLQMRADSAERGLPHTSCAAPETTPGRRVERTMLVPGVLASGRSFTGRLNLFMVRQAVPGIIETNPASMFPTPLRLHRLPEPGWLPMP